MPAPAQYPQSPILTITLNPALDLCSETDHVRAGPKLRCTAPRRDPGGGGINVSRAIRFLGGDSLALVALGGTTGMAVQQLMDAEGLRVHCLPIPGETRQSLSITETGTGAQFRFVLPGPGWSSMEMDALIATCVDLIQPGSFVVLSGSLPPGVRPNLPNTICSALSMSGARVVVDTSGAALQTLARAPRRGATPPMVLRFDHQEAGELADQSLDSPAATADFAEDLVQRGAAQVVMIARGAEGNVLADGTKRLLCRPAPVPVRSMVGAGDSFVGAAVLRLAQGGTMAEALHRGTAAATAAVMTDATELCRPEDVERLLPHCRMEPV
ncbi:MAG: 1-phosphofructokinase family hexose kinase [Rhodobacteraceae bacterium]|nr:1-phosphofructokinase family hexose kinase [Paracoccaceae bacterium]